MNRELIYNDPSQEVRPNFTGEELFSGSFNAPEAHYLPIATLDAIQAARDFYGIPIKPTSTLRTASHNFAVGGGNTSQHLEQTLNFEQYPSAFAIDFQAFYQSERKELVQLIYNDLFCKGPLYQLWRDMGIKGIGIYKTFVHIDTGESPLNTRSQMTFWDNSEGEFGPVQLTTAFMNSIPEETAPGQCGNPMCEGCLPPEALPPEYQEFQSKKKGLLEQLFAWDTEDGVRWNSTQRVALILAFLTVAAFAYFYGISRKAK